MSNRANIEVIAMAMHEASKQGLHWYAIGCERRDQWRLLAESVLSEDAPRGSDRQIKDAWESLRDVIPNDLGGSN